MNLNDKYFFLHTESDEVLAYIRRVLTEGDDATLAKAQSQDIAFAEYSRANWLHYLAYHNQPELVELALKRGFDINAYAQKNKETEGDSYISPLMVAVSQNATPVAKCLLNYLPSLSGFVGKKCNVLYLAAHHTSYEFVAYLLHHAQKNNQMNDLVSLCHLRDGQMFDIPRSGENLADLLIDDMLRKKIKYFKIAYFSYLSDPIKQHFAAHYKEPRMRDSDTIDALEPETRGHAADKETALKNALIIIYETLQSPDWCARLLETLEAEIIKEAKGYLPSEHLSNAYEEKLHPMGYRYCVPKPEFVPLKLDSLLKRALLNILQANGLAEDEAVKLLGFIPEVMMKEIISNGIYYSENIKSDLKLLLHGKISHMIHWVLICLMAKAGDIDLSYGENQRLAIKDILTALVCQPKTFVNLCQDETTSLWEQSIDAVYLKRYTFQDPYRLNSLLMCNEFVKLRELSACLINSHCKAMVDAAHYFSEIFKEKITVQRLWDVICLTKINSVLHFNAEEYLALQATPPQIKFPQNEAASSFLVLHKYKASQHDRAAVAPENKENKASVKKSMGATTQEARTTTVKSPAVFL